MKKRTVLFVIAIGLCGIIGFINGKIADFCVNNECLKGDKKKTSMNDEDKTHDYDYWNNENNKRSPITFFDFVKSIFKMRANNSDFYKYIEGFKFIINTFTDLYYKNQRKNDEEAEEYFDMMKDKLSEESIHNNNNKDAYHETTSERYKPQGSPESNNEQLRQLKPKKKKTNNTDIYALKNCPTIPDVKAQLRTYYCNRIQVTKAEYTTLSIDKKNKCKFYTNTDKICLCPIHYIDCLDMNQNLFCEINELKVNTDTDLLKFRNTFYYEYFNKTILDRKDSPFDFNFGLRCAYVNQTKQQGNFYLSTGNNADFDLISVNYPKNYTGKIEDYKESDIRNINTPILNYFLNSPKAIIYQEVTLSISFSIFDLLWIMPRKVEIFELTAQESADLISGKKNYQFKLDLEELLAKEDTDPIFTQSIYPKAKKGNLLFYEFKVYPTEKFALHFFTFRGEIIDES